MNDPRALISRSSMTAMQVLIVAITVGLNALDGFDVASISFAMPGIRAEWGVGGDALGFIASMELIGMCIGSLFLSGAADRIGRRSMILLCLMIMTAGMFLTTTVKNNPYELCAWRIITGIGIGGMVAILNALAAEFSNDKNRHMCVAIYAAGYPIGAWAGGLVVSNFLPVNEDWRSVFYFGAAASAAFIPIVYFLVPESVHWLSQKQPPAALEKINRILQRIGKSSIDTLPVIREEMKKLSIGDIFSPRLFSTTLILTLVYFLNITTFYFVFKWAPTIAVDMGYTQAQGVSVLSWASGAGAVGGIIFSFITLKWNVRYLTVSTLLMATVFVALVGFIPDDLQSLTLFCAAANFFTNAGVIGLYAIFAYAFPIHARAFGTGFAVGVGRGGSIVSPIIVGLLYKADVDLGFISSVMGLGTLIAAIALLFLKLRSGDEMEQTK